MDKLIITVEVVGGLTTRQQKPNLPHTPEETGRAAIDNCKARAAVMHLHTSISTLGSEV